MKKFPLLLLDAGPIIKIFTLGIWDTFIDKCDVYIARTIAENEALFTEDGCKQIELLAYEKSGRIKIVDAPVSDVKSFIDMFNPAYAADIHPGE